VKQRTRGERVQIEQVWTSTKTNQNFAKRQSVIKILRPIISIGLGGCSGAFCDHFVVRESRSLIAFVATKFGQWWHEISAKKNQTKKGEPKGPDVVCF
jgi:hypothetical protein